MNKLSFLGQLMLAAKARWQEHFHKVADFQSSRYFQKKANRFLFKGEGKCSLKKSHSRWEKQTNEDNTSSKYKLIASLHLEFIQIANVSEFTNEQMQSLSTQMRKRSH